jgi:glycosyltransferase involved in cell wall biosynthesis
MLVENPQVDPDFQHLYKPIIERASNITYDTKRNLRILDYLHNQTFLSKTRQIYHGYERKSPEQVITREMLSLDPETFIFVFAGRGIREKGWEEVIQAAINLHEKGFNLALLMFGDSDYVQSLKKRYEQTNIIMFMGETSNLAGYLAIADCGILPTYFFSESQPLTVIEFLAAGLPVISTDIGEIKAMLEMDRTSAGIALPLKNGKLSEALLRDAMKEVLQDKQKCQAFKEVALSIFKAKFDIEQFAHAYVSLYTREGRFS